MDNENLTLWEELKPVDNFPTYRLGEVANRTRCNRCSSVVWHLLSRAGFEVRLDPERISREEAEQMAAQDGETFLFPTLRTGDSFVAQFLCSTASAYDMANADFERRIYLAWHRCNPNNIRTEVIDHWKGRL